MDPRDAALAIGRTRMALGLAAIVVPGLATRLMFGRRGDNPGGRLFARMLGGRDLALGLGVVIAVDRGAPLRGWLEAGALADAVDCIGALVAREDLPARTVAGAAAASGGAAIAGLWLSRRVHPPPAAEPGQPEAALTGHPPSGHG
jgi:hypothetical protein